MIGLDQEDDSLGALDFEMEINSRKLIFSGKVPRVQNRWFSIILCIGFFVIQDVIPLIPLILG